MAQELKEHLFVPHSELQGGDELTDAFTIAKSYYLKSEADKVIAELKSQKAQAEEDCAYWKTMAQKNAADNAEMAKQRAEALKMECHQKHKRCLAMARWCGYFANYWECCEPPDCGAFIARAKFNRKWHKRWLELAEKFKEAK